jgi:CCDC93, coiled-coil domain
LKSVNCPILINPVQIHGLDLQPIYQLLQWCVKNLLESRDERNAINKTISRNYYDNKFGLRRQCNFDKMYSETKYNLIHTGRIYRQTKKTDMEINDPLRVYFTLIEYGMNKDLSFQRTLVDLLKKKNLIEEKDQHAKQDKQTEKVDNNITNEEKVKLEEVLQNNIEQIIKPSIRVNTSAIEEIFSDNIDLISQEIEKYENLKGDESIDRIKLFVKEKERLENNIINLHSQVKEYENELSTMQENVEISNREVIQAQEEIHRLTEIYEDNVNNINIARKIRKA